MNRIDRIFQDLRAADRKALMPYITAGDPDLATTARLLPALEQAGASVVEIGLPFSDPVADGPVIQDSMTHALKHGFRVRDLFQHIAEVRPSTDLGLVAMVSYSIVHRIGPATFAREAAQAGFDGLIVPDLPLEAAADFHDTVADAGLILSMLISPTTDIDRARRIADASSGFIYLLSRAGTTGERTDLPPELPQRIQRLREQTPLPVAVGFGIATAEQVRSVVSVADAAIVGSAIVRRITHHRDRGPDALVHDVAAFTRELALGLEQVPGAP